VRRAKAAAPVDISRPVAAGIPVWPGDTSYDYRMVARIRDGAAVNVGAVTMSVHTGAHADAPLHFDDAGGDIASADLSKYVGPCVVVRVRPRARGIVPSDLPRGTDALLRRAPRLLLRTYEERPGAFDEGMSHLTPETAEHLASRGVVLVGLDTDSMDAFDSKDLPSHRRLAAAGIAILEGLDLSAVRPGVHFLVALPLRLVGADGSPVRAVLLPEALRRGRATGRAARRARGRAAGRSGSRPTRGGRRTGRPPRSGSAGTSC
jgi:arylformamidase